MKTLAVRAAVTLVACASAGALFAPAAAASTSTPTRTAATPCATRTRTASSCATRSDTPRRPRPQPPPRPSACRPRPSAATSSTDPTGACRAPSRSPRSPASSAPGPRADWTVTDDSGALRLTNVSTGRHMGVALGPAGPGPSRPLRAGRSSPPRAARAFPEVEVNVKGQPFKGPRATARVRGFVDDHIHLGAFQFLGGRFHCGRPWSPYGVTVAMSDCVDHQPDGSAAVVENFFNTGTPVGTHSTEGWPSFAGWPRDESQTHEGTYWKWIERAWRAGLRIMVNDLVENRALCELYPLKQNNCNEMVSAYQQAEDMHALQDYIDAQFGGPGKGFLRIVKSRRGGAQGDQRRQAGDGARRRGLRGPELRAVPRHAELHHRRRSTPSSTSLESIGVQSLFPMHKFDNALGGVQVRLGRDRRARQHRQQVRDRRVLDRRALRRPRPRQRAHEPDRRVRRDVLHALRAGAHAALVPGPAAGLSAGAALQPQGADPARRVRDPRR